MITQIIDNISFHLQERCDFSFLSKYGKVFCVFDQNDSGNISFGMEDGDTKYFYDGSILYDFDNDNITICDIDFFRKKPTYNNMGEDFWGTKRLKSPEEYIYGAVIDEATNVYTLGALIFHFFGSYSEDEMNQIYKNNRFFPCARERWELSEEMYEVSLGAVKEDRSKRYQSMSDFFTNWNRAVYI